LYLKYKQERKDFSNLMDMPLIGGLIELFLTIPFIVVALYFSYESDYIKEWDNKFLILVPYLVYIPILESMAFSFALIEEDLAPFSTGKVRYLHIVADFVLWGVVLTGTLLAKSKLVAILCFSFPLILAGTLLFIALGLGIGYGVSEGCFRCYNHIKTEIHEEK